MKYDEKKVEALIHASVGELKRSSLTSLPLINEFARREWMTLDEARQWMNRTRREFKAAVQAFID